MASQLPSSAIPSPDICPTQAQCLSQMLMALPRGRAWETPQGTWRWKFFNALAAVVAFANARICALADEFFCATQSETNDVWMRQYGLPDGCDPYPNLCAKVQAQGQPNCAYWTAIAAASGFFIICGTRKTSLGARAGTARAGCALASDDTHPACIVIQVSLSRSRAYAGGPRTPTQAGHALAGRPLACPPDLSPIECLLARILPADSLVTYKAIA